MSFLRYGIAVGRFEGNRRDGGSGGRTTDNTGGTGQGQSGGQRAAGNFPGNRGKATGGRQGLGIGNSGRGRRKRAAGNRQRVRDVHDKGFVRVGCCCGPGAGGTPQTVAQANDGAVVSRRGRRAGDDATGTIQCQT